MDKVGRGLPAELRETGLGGLAGTPTGEELNVKSLVKLKLIAFHNIIEIRSHS